MTIAEAKSIVRSFKMTNGNVDDFLQKAKIGEYLITLECFRERDFQVM